MYNKIYDVLKSNFENIFGDKSKSVFSQAYFTKCTNELTAIPKENIPPQNILKYNLSDNLPGLYNKEIEESINDSCFVIAGGPSLKDVDFSLLRNKTTIVSNKSIFDIPKADYFITTDYTFLNYLKKMNLYDKWKDMDSKKLFVANCISETIQIIDGQIVDTKYNLTYELQDFDDIVICKSAKNIGFDFENFNSGYNSGFCSLQLAIVLGFKNIYLLGMDMNCDGNNTHYHNGYGKSFNKMQKNLYYYGKHFLEVLSKLKKEKPDIKIISCSKNSLLNKVITYQNIKEIL